MIEHITAEDAALLIGKEETTFEDSSQKDKLEGDCLSSAFVAVETHDLVARIWIDNRTEKNNRLSRNQCYIGA